MYEDPYYLQHFGVKGMKWGVRRSSGSGTATISRRQNRKMNKTARKEYYQEKANHIIKTALANKGDDTLIQVGTSVITGQMFVNLALSGGAFNIKATNIASIRNPKTGDFEAYNGKYYGDYQKQNFRANPNEKYTGEDLSNKK